MSWIRTSQLASTNGYVACSNRHRQVVFHIIRVVHRNGRYKTVFTACGYGFTADFELFDVIEDIDQDRWRPCVTCFTKREVFVDDAT